MADRTTESGLDEGAHDGHPSGLGPTRAGLGEPGSPRRILVLRALRLGDLLCAVPAFRALRGRYPDAEIVLLGLPWSSAFVERFGAYLDGFREFPGLPGLPEREPDAARLSAFVRAIRAERFDLVIQLHGTGPIVNPFLAGLGATRIAGFYPAHEACPGSPGLFIPWPTEGLEIRRLLALTTHLGATTLGEHLEFPVLGEDRERLATAMAGRLPGGAAYACIHAGASVPERTWPLARFAEVGEALMARGLKIVLTGTEAEAASTARLASSLGASCLDLAGRTDLGMAAALLADARLLVCNDTGVSHLAAAMGTPSVVVSTGDNPSRWSPIDRARHRVLCREGGVGADEVLREAADLLAGVGALARVGA